MKILSIFFLIYCFFKAWYYGLYELKENKNKPAAISIFFMACCGLIFPSIVIIYWF
jgi:hypothetical protein